MTAIEERRQRAREAAFDVNGDPFQVDRYAVEAAIETATRIRVIDPEIERAMYAELAKAEPGQHYRAVRLGLRAAFEAAGFEVEE